MSGIAFDTVVIGGGPAGLTAAYKLVEAGRRPLVLEASNLVGGIARTESHNGYRFDIGGHRFFTKVKEVEQLWEEVMGDDFIDVPRLSRIYYRGHYFDYPLQIASTLQKLGAYESMRILLSYFKWQVRPFPEEKTFEQWVINRFGGRLYWHFFRTYTEKVWGIPGSEIRSEWAAQRIKNFSLPKAVINALTGASDASTLIKSFKYPRLGPGMMWERFAELINQRGGEVRMNTRVVAVHRDGPRVTAVTAQSGDQIYRIDAEHFINSMPLPLLISQFDAPAPDPVLAAAGRLKYRDFLIVTLVLDHADPFPDNWIYIHSSEVKVGRIQNFRSWSKEMVPNPDTASIGMEYFCHKGDGLWASDDADLIKLAGLELEQLGLAKATDVVDGVVIRQPKAYPVYDERYADNLDVVREWIQTLDNLQTVGRNGMHRYNNQDHSMLTAMLAVRNILGDHHDLWNVNVERSYHEEFVTKKSNGKAVTPAASVYRSDDRPAVAPTSRVEGRDINVGLIGYGRISENVHLPRLLRTHGLRLVGVAEADATRRELATRCAPGATMHADYHTLLNDPAVDAVMICLPNHLHADASVAAFKAGKHVYLEKPIAPSITEAQRVIDAWQGSGRVGMMGFNYRFHPMAMAMKRRIADGEIGGLVGVRTVFTTAMRDLPAWKQQRVTGGGALLDLASHHIDLACFILGRPVTRVAAILRDVRTQDDVAVLTLEMEGGLPVQIFASMASVNEDRIDVYGEKGSLSYDRHRSSAVWSVEPERGYGLRHRARRVARVARRDVGNWFRGLRPVHEPSYSGAFAAFRDAVAGHAPCPIDLRSGLHCLHVTAAAELSAVEQLGDAVEIELAGHTGPPSPLFRAVEANA